jgi:chloramphenicol-sensitive protein RarD
MSPASLAILAYAWWGLSPIYWKLLTAFPASELILYRVLLSSVFLMPFFFRGAKREALRRILLSPRTLLGLLASGLLIGFNWYLYVWAVNNGHLVESSLGYFINPLMNVALGLLVLGESMRRNQKIACLFAAFGAGILAWSNGAFPWIALLLALSFALYGLIRKVLAVPTIPGTFFETLVLSLPAGVALGWMYKSGLGHATSATAGEWVVLAFCGLVTTLPLLGFAEAAKRMPLSVLGFFQFISPSLQFLLGVFVYKEPFGLHQWLSFALIWAGLAFFLTDLARRR